MFTNALSRLLLGLMLSIGLLFGVAQSTIAAVTQLEEYPGQMLYQSRQALQDQTGQPWQAIAFTRIHPEGSATVSLRLVGFPGAVALDHQQPLTLTTALGKSLTARDISSEISLVSRIIRGVFSGRVLRDLAPRQGKIP